jgi:hypothetical protein
LDVLEKERSLWLASWLLLSTTVTVLLWEPAAPPRPMTTSREMTSTAEIEVAKVLSRSGKLLVSRPRMAGHTQHCTPDVSSNSCKDRAIEHKT